MKRRIVASQSNSDEEALINLTPLIDVVFVMLIMFIVVAPILELDQVELARGGAQTKELSSTNQENRSITLHIKKDNTVFLNKQQITLSKLTAQLKEAKKRYPKDIPMLFNDKKSHFGTYQEVKNALEEAGFQDMDIVLSP
jgi:biopolymer transport protein ExbD